VLLDESIESLSPYDDPDPGIYDPPPSTETIFRAAYARRARKWEVLLRGHAEDGDRTAVPVEVDSELQDSASPDWSSKMSAEDRGNSALILLMMLAQAYYKMLECRVALASWCSTLDLELNESYLWTTGNISNLLKNHEELKDFPGQFEPMFPDLYPSTLDGYEWENMVAPQAEQFLSTVQRYVHAKRTYDPEQGSEAWIFVELFRPAVNLAIKRAIAYYKRIQRFCQQNFGETPPKTTSPVKATPRAKKVAVARKITMSSKPLLKTVKRLFALSGNRCAFPKCPTLITIPESGTVIGQICHIMAQEKNGPRYEASQTEKERQSFDNLVLMCGVHHKIIDDDVTTYTVERLRAIKAEHQAKEKGDLPPDDDIAQKLLATIDITTSYITSINQQGGQAAYQIINYYVQSLPGPAPVLTPLIEWRLTSVDRIAGIDQYDFVIYLRNDGPRVIREFSIDVEIPIKYANNASIYPTEVKPPRRSNMKQFRHTQQSWNPPPVLHPGDRHSAFQGTYILSEADYLAGIPQSIDISIYSGDELVTSREFSIANMLNAERVNQILSDATK
jgi:hypothetical protein